MTLAIRPACEGDLPALTEIYNHYVRETPITFDVERLSPWSSAASGWTALASPAAIAVSWR